MIKRIRTPKGSPRERIMSVATDLFYRQGYRATGINEVIERSGVAKATFYSHFPSKDDLALAYLEQGKESVIAYIDSCIQAARTPRDRFLAVMQSMEPWLLETQFRGCGFINMAAEVPDQKHPLRKVGREVYDVVRSRVAALSEELIASDAKRYGRLDAAALTREYLVVYTGAIALAELYHAIWPVKDAMDSVRRLIGETPG
jgi:AcrR family transcriptional regulator